MTMTRQHFEAIALALKESRPPEVSAMQDRADLDIAKYEQWRTDVRTIAEVLLAHNPRFDTRFYAACGYETTEANAD